MRRLLRLLTATAVVLLLFYLADGGRLLVVNQPRQAGAILVLDGEYDVRVERALELLHQGYAPVVIFDLQDAPFYRLRTTEIARNFIEKLPPEDRARARLCPMQVPSTRDEARDAAVCLAPLQPRSLLLVTSDYHTRRALLVFRHQYPGVDISVASASDPGEFGLPWWRRRQWAKHYFYESTRLLWWELVDRWR